MANYYFSSLDDGEAVTFHPGSDTLLFDSCFLTPDSVSVLSCPASVVLLAQNRRITLIGVTVDQLNAENVRFFGYDLRDAAASLAAPEAMLSAAFA